MDAFKRRGEWWQQGPGGVWLRWNEGSQSWEEQSAPPPPPSTDEGPVPTASNTEQPQLGNVTTVSLLGSLIAWGLWQCTWFYFYPPRFLGYAIALGIMTWLLSGIESMTTALVARLFLLALGMFILDFGIRAVIDTALLNYPQPNPPNLLTALALTGVIGLSIALRAALHPPSRPGLKAFFFGAGGQGTARTLLAVGLVATSIFSVARAATGRYGFEAQRRNPTASGGTGGGEGDALAECVALGMDQTRRLVSGFATADEVRENFYDYYGEGGITVGNYINTAVQLGGSAVLDESTEHIAQLERFCDEYAIR